MEPRLADEASDALFLTTYRVHMVIPSVIGVGETFSLRVTLIGPQGMPVPAPERPFRLSATEGVDGLPANITFTEKTGGRIHIDNLQVNHPCRLMIKAQLQDREDVVIPSNPAWVYEAPPFRIYWGDMHVHTTYSNCSSWACKDPEFCYAYARDVSFLDFAAAADHLRGIHSDPERWPRLQELVQTYDAPGHFVPFLGFESSHKVPCGGDNNAYFLEKEAPYFWLDREDMKGNNPSVQLSELWQFLQNSGKTFMTIPHHTGRAAKYRDFSDPVYAPEYEPLFEIYSGWGSSERYDSPYPLRLGNTHKQAYFQDALRHGCRYGVMASSDAHTTMTGAEVNQRFPLGHAALGWHCHHGLTGVLADSLSRESLWDALTRRRCYGTTFARSLMDLRIGDAQMGEALPIDRRDPLQRRREIRVRYFSSEEGRIVLTLIRNSEEIQQKEWNPDAEEVVFEDESSLTGTAVRDAQFHPEPFTVYYVRAEHKEGQVQWSSPIWLDLV